MKTLPTLYGFSSRLDLRLCQPDPGHFRCGVDNRRNGVVIDLEHSSRQSIRAAITPSSVPFVSQHRSTNDIANGPNAGRCGSTLLVDNNETTGIDVDIQFWIDQILAQAVVRPTQTMSRSNSMLLGLAALFVFNLYDVTGNFGFADFRAEPNVQALLLELPRRFLSQYARSTIGRKSSSASSSTTSLPSLTPDTAELQPDDARADNAESRFGTASKASAPAESTICCPVKFGEMAIRLALIRSRESRFRRVSSSVAVGSADFDTTAP